MSLMPCVRRALGVIGLLMAFPALILAQTGSGYVTNGLEYAPAGILAGDQINPALSLGSGGGFLVWQDNITDGDGYGITAVRLDSSFSPTLGNFRVNQNGTNDQENPRVSVLKGGGAAFVWQGGRQSFQHIFARFLNSSNLFVGGDVMVNTATNKYQANPAIATLANSNVIVAWGSFNQDNTNVNQFAMQGVYAQILSPTGQKIGSEFQVNQFTMWNQRTPSVAAFPNGNFVIAWASEQQRATNLVDVMARIYNSAGTPVTSEFLVNTGTNVCANPSVAVASDNTFIITWYEKDLVLTNNSWDVFARNFSSAGAGGTTRYVNTQLYGDQYAPKIASLGNDYLVVWTSLGQDGSREGVFGQFLHSDGTHAGGEFRVNTTFLNAQKYPAVASDGAGRSLVVWSTYTGGLNSLDLNAQRYATYQAPLVAPDPPVVTPINSSRLTIAWAPLAGFSVSNYGLYIDGAGSPIAVSNNMYSLSPLTPSTTHSFVLDYLLTDGRRSPQSAPPAFGTTWGADDNSDGLPDDWQTLFWGPNYLNWLAGNTVLNNPNGPSATVLQVFQWGANPLDPTTWLKVWVSSSPQGDFLNWTTVPGSIYQVETSSTPAVAGSWSNLTGPRFAAGSSDSLFLGSSSPSFKAYRIKRLRF